MWPYCVYKPLYLKHLKMQVGILGYVGGGILGGCRIPGDTAVSSGYRFRRSRSVSWGYRGIPRIPCTIGVLRSRGILGHPKCPEDTIGPGMPRYPGDSAVSPGCPRCPGIPDILRIPPCVLGYRILRIPSPYPRMPEVSSRYPPYPSGPLDANLRFQMKCVIISKKQNGIEPRARG